MKKWIVFLLALGSSTLLTAQQSQASVDAPNLDFSLGNFTHWKRYLGTFRCDNPSADDNLKTYTYTWNEVTGHTDRLMLMGNVQTLDPIMQCDNLLCNPDPGKDVARIGKPQTTEGMRGNGCNTSYLDAAAEKLEYTYTVTQATSILKYRFATVLHIPDEGGEHVGPERPYFSINVTVKNPDGTMATPTCSSYETVVNEASSTLLRGTSPCAASSGIPKNYMYQPWTSAMVDLRQFIGSEVTITVLSHDCLVRCNGTPAAGGHEAYGYFRAEAMDLSLSTKVCEGEEAQIAAPEGFAGYAWSRSDHFPITADAATPNVVSIPAIDVRPGVMYNCVLSDELGCAAIQIGTELNPVAVNPSFTYTTDCEGQVELTSTSTANGDALVGWLWELGENQVAGEVANYAFAASGNYEVTLTATTKNGCKKSITQPVTVPYFPKLVIDAPSQICKGQELSLSVQNVEVNSTVQWSSSVAGQTFPSTTSLITTPTQSQTYTVNVTDAYGCQYQESANVLVFDTTRITIQGADIVCPSEPVELTLQGANLSDVRWNLPNATGATSVEVFPSVSSLYYVEAVDAHGCLVRAEHTVDVHPRPVLQIDAPSVCSGDDGVVRITGAQSYLWDDSSQASNTSGEAVFANLTEDKTVLVTGYSEHACTHSETVTIRVKEKPTVSIEGVIQRCFNSEPFELLAHGADTYTWNGTTSGATFTAPSDRNHRVTLVGTIENCPSDPVEVELTTLQVPTISAVQEAVVICEGDEAILQVTGADSYQWFNTTETNNQLVVSPVESKVYTVKGITDDGCLSAELEIPVTVHSANQVNLRIAEEIACLGRPDSVVIVAEGALTYKWSAVPERDDVSFNASDRLDFTYDTPTTIIVEGTNEFACSATAQIELQRLPQPVFEFKVEPTWVEVGKSEVRFTGLQPSSDMTWYWNTGDGSELLQARDTIYGYNIDNFTQPFVVGVTAIDPYGCIYEGETEIKIWKEMWAPTAFTPNGDGVNDVFQFYGTHNLTTLEYYIYNRLGEIVFEGKSSDDTWDGTYQGKPCPWGVYGWVAHYTATVNDALRESTLRGQVSIVK